MLLLTRTIRFSVNAGEEGWGDPSNTFASFPTMRGLGRSYELDVRCRGDVDPVTGYFLNIKEIDQAARATLVPAIESACRRGGTAAPERVLAEALPRLDEALGPGRVWGVRWRLSPYYSVEVQMASRTVAVLRQQFEFAAAHRLHVPGLSDEKNRELFGKCHNPSGHGHNYRVEPAVEVPVGPGAPALTLADLERVTHETIIRRFDHMHLNVDTREFATEGGLNPSVENIAKVCFELLDPALRTAFPRAAEQGVRLRCVTVWETDKTSCTYPA